MNRMASDVRRIQAPLSRRELLARWEALCKDPYYREVAGKVELNEWGEVVGSPPVGKVHGLLAMRLGRMLEDALGGRAMVEVGVATAIGVRGPDVLWCTDAWLAAHPENSPLSSAPEICVEIRSPDDSKAMLREKAHAYVESGAIEAWIVFPEEREVEMHGRGGRLAHTSFAVNLAALFD